LPETLNIALFASGKGSNLRAILDAIENGSLRSVRIVLVISDHPESGAIAIARGKQIEAMCCRREFFDSDEQFDNALLEELNRRGVNLVVLGGYLKKLGAGIVRRYRDRILNIHPALLPAFGGRGMYGMRVHEAVLASRARISGATVHIVDEEYDNGPIVLQRAVNIADDETPQSLAQKVQMIEAKLYPDAIRLFAEGKITVKGKRVVLANSK
jgi:phosphoribosylglycinamide formyltransferase 1